MISRSVVLFLIKLKFGFITATGPAERDGYDSIDVK
jgi:hypothetical protein